MLLTDPPLFPAGSLRAYALSIHDIPALQRFFEANPAYFLTIDDQPPGPGAAEEEYQSEPPAEMSFTQKWNLGLVDNEHALTGMASVLSGLISPSVWHIGLFIIATARHGTGDAVMVYQALEAWAARHGAQWLRLGVIAGNTRAERFWEKAGFCQVRTRNDVAIGKRTHTLRVMVKPLAGGSLAEYFTLVERDRPGEQPDRSDP
jgi:GNAT superfamily N-acetyltransferase